MMVLTECQSLAGLSEPVVCQCCREDDVGLAQSDERGEDAARSYVQCGVSARDDRGRDARLWRADGEMRQTEGDGYESRTETALLRRNESEEAFSVFVVQRTLNQTARRRLFLGQSRTRQTQPKPCLFQVTRMFPTAKLRRASEPSRPKTFFSSEPSTRRTLNEPVRTSLCLRPWIFFLLSRSTSLSSSSSSSIGQKHGERSKWRKRRKKKSLTQKIAPL